MSKKIKTYSWIHDLNKAAIESQLLGEAKMYKDSVMLNEAKAGRPSKFPADFSDFQYDPTARAEIDAQKKSAGTELSNIKRSTTQLANQINTVNLSPVGDAEAEKRQHDSVAEMIDPFEDDDSAEEAALAAEIRREALANRQARWDAEDLAAEQDMEDRADANLWSGPSGRSGEMNPMNQKINGFLRR